MRFISRPLLRWCLLAIALSLLLSIPAYANSDNINFEYEQEHSTLAPTDKQRGGSGGGPSWGLPNFDFNIWELLGNFFSWAWDALTDFFSSIWDSIKNWYSDLSDPIKGLLKGIGIGILVVVAVVVVVILLVKFGVIAAVSIAALAIGAVLAIAATALYGYLVGGENFNALVAALIGLSVMALPILAELGVLAAIGQFVGRVWLSAGVRFQLFMFRVESFISGLIATLRARFLWASLVTHFRLVALQARIGQWLITAGTLLRSQYWRLVTAGYLRWTAIQARVGQWLTTLGGWLGRQWTAFMSTRMMQFITTRIPWKYIAINFSIGAAPAALFHAISIFTGDFNPVVAFVDILLAGVAGVFGARFVFILKTAADTVSRVITFVFAGVLGGTISWALGYFKDGSMDWANFTAGAITATVLLPFAYGVDKLSGGKFTDFIGSLYHRMMSDKVEGKIKNGIEFTVNFTREKFLKLQKWWHDWRTEQVNVDQGDGGEPKETKDRDYNIYAP